MYNILIFGTGDLAQRAMAFLNSAQVNVIAYVTDSLVATEFCEKNVIPPQRISCFDYDYIFIATAHYQTATSKLLALGVKPERMLHLHMLDCAVDEFWKQKGPAKGVTACLFEYIDNSEVLAKSINKGMLLKHLNPRRWINLDYIFAILSSHEQFSELFSAADIINICGIRYPRQVIERFKYYLCIVDILMSYCLLTEKQRESISAETFLHMRPTRPGTIIEGYEFGPVYLRPGDTVIDCGASLGLFSGFAGHRVGVNGHVFSFEPMPYSLGFLKQTAACYKNITIVPQALYHTDTQLTFNTALVESVPGSMCAEVTPTGQDEGKPGDYSAVDAVSLDSWASKNQVASIDFIKADIEGAERHMLLGAKRILRDMAPRLSICKYHLPDDPVVLRKIITSANPKYTFIERGDVLFAYVS